MTADAIITPLKESRDMDTLRVGLIGAGGWARHHLDVIRQVDSTKVVGITSRTESKARRLADEYGIPKCVGSLDSLVGEAAPDALMVLVSASQMYDVTVAALEFGLPLFVEKPAGLFPAQNWKLARMARERSVPNMVGFNRRFYSIFDQGLRIIRVHGPLMGVAVEGHERMWRVRQIGKFTENELSQWLFLNSIHTIDLLRFFGGEPTNISAIAHRYIEPLGDQFGAVMELESGAIGHYQSHWHSPGGWRVVLYGHGVTVEFKPLEEGRWFDDNLEEHRLEPEPADVRCKPGFLRQMEAFVRLARDGTFEWPMQDLGDAYKTMILAQQLSSNLSDRVLET